MELTASSVFGRAPRSYAAGLRFAVDLSAQAGERVSAIEVKPRVQQAQWGPLDPSATYNVVVNSFIAQGKDGYGSLQKLKSVDTYVEQTQAFVNYLSSFDGAVPSIPEDELSTTRFVSRAGCDHSQQTSLLDQKETPNCNAVP